jgi:hypothetical protein
MSGTSLLSAADVAVIDQLKIDGWETSYAVADPKIELVLFRGVDELAVQLVVANYPNRATQQRGGASAMAESASDIAFRRPISYDFDVEVGDRFALADETGVITRVTRRNGMIWAEASLEGGNP